MTTRPRRRFAGSAAGAGERACFRSVFDRATSRYRTLLGPTAHLSVELCDAVESFLDEAVRHGRGPASLFSNYFGMNCNAETRTWSCRYLLSPGGDALSFVIGTRASSTVRRETRQLPAGYLYFDRPGRSVLASVDRRSLQAALKMEDAPASPACPGALPVHRPIPPSRVSRTLIGRNLEACSTSPFRQTGSCSRRPELRKVGSRPSASPRNELIAAIQDQLPQGSFLAYSGRVSSRECRAISASTGARSS